MGMIDNDIMRIAERRLNLVTADDLERLGLSERTIRRRVGEGQLHRVATGVFATSGPLEDISQWGLAICLAHPSAVLSYSTAAAFWGLRRAPKDRVDVTVPHGFRPRLRSVVLHYSNAWPQHHVVDTMDGGRVTSVARTVFDLGGILDEPGHMSVIEDVRNKGLATDAELGEVYADLGGKGRRGSGAWPRLAALTERVGRPTMSERELELHDALVAAGLPAAVQQHPVRLPWGRIAYLDLAYVDCRLDVEIDHSYWHGTASGAERDRARDNGLAVLGWERLRFTERMVEGNRALCVATVRTVRDRRLADRNPSAA